MGSAINKGGDMNILIPVDGSDNAVHAVEYAIRLNAALREPAKIFLLNVQWNVAAGNVKLFINQDMIDEYYREQGMAALQQARDKLDAAGLSYQYHISVGRPAETIVQYADEHGMDQIVMGAQGHENLARFLLGSVSGKVAGLTKLPVVITH